MKIYISDDIDKLIQKYYIDYKNKRILNTENEIKKIDDDKYKIKKAIYQYIINKIKYYKIILEINKNNIYNVDIKKIYKLNKLLGKGAHGSVYKISKNRCIKIIEVKNLEKELKEYKMAYKAGKKNICPKIYNYKLFINDTEDKIKLVIEMEYIKNSIDVYTYFDKYLKKIKSEDKIKKIKEELYNMTLNKIKELHKMKILHRDIHPGNILIVLKEDKITPKKIYIIDYGLSKTINNMNTEYLKEDIFGYESNNSIKIVNYIYDKLIEDKHILIN